MTRVVLLTVVAIQWIVASGFGQTATSEDYQKQLVTNPRNSLAHYRLGELYFEQRRLVAAANEFRAATKGDLKPKWTEVWSYIKLGNIFDITSQRERAISEYLSAQDTKDNTSGALDQANKYLRSPYR